MTTRQIFIDTETTGLSWVFRSIMTGHSGLS